MTVAVVPIKDLARAKQRLANRLGPAERRTLVLCMLDDVLAALSDVPGLSGIMVVTSDPEVSGRARARGAEVLEEAADGGYSAAVGRAARTLDERGASAMLSVPGDVPGVTSAEITELLAASSPSPSIVLVPSRDGRGTNAALVAHPLAIDLRFGEPSFAAHVARAKDAGIATRVLELPGFSLDLDTAADLDAFLAKPSTTATHRFLVEGGRLRHRAEGALSGTGSAE